VSDGAQAPRRAYVTAGGAELHYLEWPGAGPPLVLLHATGLLAALWAPVARALAANFHVYALDFPGHGDSAHPSRTYRWEAFAEDARAFMATLGLGAALVMGHSMGATVAALLAARYPRHVLRLALVEPVVMVPEVIGREIAHPGVPTAAGTRKRRAVWPDRASMVASYTGRGPFAHWEPALLALYAAEGTADRADGSVELKCPPDLEAEMYHERSFLDPWPALRAIACPTLLVYGTEPRPYPRARAQTVQSAILGARLAYVQGAGHFVPQEQPAALAACVRLFLVGA
jgi:pimeloyl-ACP methyl ester carboxylesterase